MDEKEFKALQETMPWTHVTIPAPRGQIGTVLRVLNNQGREVDLVTMIRFLEVITYKLAKPTKEQTT